MKQLTAFQRDLMYAIKGLEGPNGLDIKHELESYYHSEILDGRLYPNLDVLVEKGLVDKGQYDNRTNIYTLTEKGENELEARIEWKQQQIASAGVLPPEAP